MIKSLKDSIVFQQAEEEAQKKAKTEADDHSQFDSAFGNENKDDSKEVSNTDDEKNKSFKSQPPNNEEVNIPSHVKSTADSQKQTTEKSLMNKGERF